MLKSWQRPKPRWWRETPDGGVEPMPEDTYDYVASLVSSGQMTLQVAHDENPDGKYVNTQFTSQDRDAPDQRADPNVSPLVYESQCMKPAWYVGSLVPMLQETRRYRSRQEALAGHRELCLEYLGRLPTPKAPQTEGGVQ